MTDSDDRPPHDDSPSSGELPKDEDREQDQRSPGQRGVVGLARIAETRRHGGPTDPEVPSAKRRGALRRQRSLVGLTAVIVGLLAITLGLLYRASVKVGEQSDSNDETLRADEARAGMASPPRAEVNEGSKTGLTPPPGRSVVLGADAPVVDRASTDSAAAPASASPHPKASPPALDIIRTPAF